MAASTFTSKNCKFDLFISHRGPDVKMTIASCLYYWLAKSHGLQVFLDYQELEGGQITDTQIKEAIASASLHVVIFSPGYADSEWCLEELNLIIESGKPLIPIFYKVKPDDLQRAQENGGAYAEALKKQELCHNSTTVGNWRNALYKAADFAGFDLDTFNRDEGKLMNKVVKCVLKRVKSPWRRIERFNGGIEEFNDLSHARKGIVRISLVFEFKCKKMALHCIATIKGVESVELNLNDMEITVIASADPVCLVAQLRKFGFAGLLSVGPA